MTSSVSPEVERAITTSSGWMMPMSPWMASAGCRKTAGLPVEVMVAAILRPIRPDLPMPVTTTWPRQLEKDVDGGLELVIDRAAGLLK